MGEPERNPDGTLTHRGATTNLQQLAGYIYSSQHLKDVGREIHEAFVAADMEPLFGNESVARAMGFHKSHNHSVGEFSAKCIGQILLAIRNGRCHLLDAIPLNNDKTMWGLAYDGQPIGYVVTHLGIAVGVDENEAMEFYRRQALALVKPTIPFSAAVEFERIQRMKHSSMLSSQQNNARMAIDQFKAALYNRPLP